MTDKKRIAIVRVRGRVHVGKDIEDTLRFLNLTRINHCVVVDNRKEYMGMIKKVNDYVTWGEICPDTLEKLLENRGRLNGNKPLTEEHLKKNTKYKSIEKFVDDFMKFKAELKDIPGLKPIFRLAPPRKGYDRGGIKHPYSVGGALGYRGERINELLERMI
ncbi:MAG: 50S ribosomal protein L30 [Candidatus Altiarchaeales archaeon]|nr:MAG: 50S ribosomal protein L30 [Candidatus Altiarchaeales archaeon]